MIHCTWIGVLWPDVLLYCTVAGLGPLLYAIYGEDALRHGLFIFGRAARGITCGVVIMHSAVLYITLCTVRLRHFGHVGSQ